MIRNVWYRWIHRNDTQQQREKNAKQAREELKQAIQDVREDMKNEPADRFIISLNDSLNEMEEALK